MEVETCLLSICIELPLWIIYKGAGGFHETTQEIGTTEQRLLIVDGHASYITIEFRLSVNIIAYYLLAHSAQPLDVGLLSPLQQAYGVQGDRLVRFGSYERQLCGLQHTMQHIPSRISLVHGEERDLSSSM